MHKGLILIVIFFLLGSVSYSQSELYDEPTIIYNKQLYGGLIIHSSGWGGTITTGKYKGAHKVRLLSLDIVGMKHGKEIKSYNPVYEDSKSYIYGKINSFYIIRPGIGRKKIITDKLRKSGVQVGYSWSIGPSLGFTKPIYLEIGYPDIPYEYVVSEKYDPEKHYFNNIYGRASGFNGLNELSIHPGGFFKFALNFEYSDEKDRLKGIETGITIDAYLEEIPILAEEIVNKNKQLFLSYYLTIFIGKKYNKR